MAAVVSFSLYLPIPAYAAARVSFPTVPLQRVRASSSHAAPDPALLRRPSVSPPPPARIPETVPAKAEALEAAEGEGNGKRRAKKREGDGQDPEDWEDQILQDTVPLVGFVRMLLHSGKYKNGDRLSPDHEQTIIERLLPFHPAYEAKIGCGVDYITVGLHPDFENSRCLFIAKKDGELVDFSFWKCIKGLIREKYPLHADNFILKHFRRRQEC